MSGEQLDEQALVMGIEMLVSTNPMPLRGGMFARKVLKASRPPADAPMPTISDGGIGGRAGAVRRLVPVRLSVALCPATIPTPLGVET